MSLTPLSPHQRLCRELLLTAGTAGRILTIYFMSKLTAAAVEAVFMDCLFKDGEDTSNPAIAEGVINKFGFHRERLAAHEPEIGAMLDELPDEFQSDKGGGWSFLNACMTRDGEQWGEHNNIEQLMALGIACGKAKMMMPREMWAILPGGMPYFQVIAPPRVPVAA